MIIDFHTHAYPPAIAEKGTRYVYDFYEFAYHPRAGVGTTEDLNACCAEAGVGYKVLLAVALRPGNVESINHWLAGCLDEHTFGFGALHPRSENPIALLEQFSQMGFLGVKYHPDMQEFYIDDPKMFPVYAWCAANGMPVCFHLGDPRYGYSSPLGLARVLDTFPELKVIAPHLGGYTMWDNGQIDPLLGNKNVYLDTSSTTVFLPRERIAEIVRAHGVDNVLFGTDYPITTQAEELERFNALPLTEAEKEAILYKNAARFLSLDINR